MNMTAPFDIFMAGPITGVHDYKQRFAIAYTQLRNEFFVKNGRVGSVWNPAMMPDGRSNEWYMRRCVDAMFESPDCVVALLNGWEGSKGARAEHALAVSLGRAIVIV